MGKTRRRSAAAVVAAVTAAAAVDTQPTESVSSPTSLGEPTEQVSVSGQFPSIRQLILAGIAVGMSTKDIGAQLAVEFPTSQAAAKFQRHVSWYRGQLKRAAKGQVADMTEPSAD